MQSTPEPAPPSAASPLTQLAAFLNEEGYTLVHTLPDAIQPVEQISLLLDQQQDRLTSLRLVPLNGLLPPTELDDRPLILHGTAILPFNTPKEKLADVMRTLFIFNRLLPVCSFGFSPDTGVCYLQATLLLEPGELAEASVREVIGQAAFAIQNYAPALQAISAGQISLQEHETHLDELGFLPAPVLPDSFRVPRS